MAHTVDRSKEAFRVSRNAKTYEVKIDSDITLDDYKAITPAADWKLLEDYAKKLKGKRIVFLNPTMEGGGVAMLRPPFVHILRMFGVDAHWFVMHGQYSKDDPNPFEFTKLMHNISQRVTDERITAKGKAIHEDWCKKNAEVLTKQKEIIEADIIVIDDPQPAPLKKYIDKVNPDVKYVWRNHIDTSYLLMSDPTTPQGEVASYILDECGIRDVDAVVAHPVEAFIHPGMSEKTYFGPATVERFDDLNKELTPEEIKDGLDFINEQIKLKNETLSEDDQLSPISPNRQRIGLVARFDESKGMDKAMAIGVKARELMRKAGVAEADLPQVVIVGNGSVDDPSGIPMFEAMMKERNKYPKDKADIVLMRLPHNYKAINALMYPTPEEEGVKSPAMVGMQTSLAEGCETRISDWIGHGVPMIVANRGGMPLQVKEGESGIILDFSRDDFDLDRGAEFIADLFTNPDAYAAMRNSTLLCAKDYNEREYVTTANVTRFCRVFDRIEEGLPADRIWLISELVEQEK